MLFRDKKGRFRKPKIEEKYMPRISSFFALYAVLVMVSCSIYKPFNIAETPEQRYYALIETYNIVLEDILEVAVDLTLPADVRSRAQQAALRATPIVDQFDRAFSAYISEKAKYDAGQTTEERLDIVAANLELWVVKVENAIADLSAVVAGE